MFNEDTFYCMCSTEKGKQRKQFKSRQITMALTVGKKLHQSKLFFSLVDHMKMWRITNDIINTSLTAFLILFLITAHRQLLKRDSKSASQGHSVTHSVFKMKSTIRLNYRYTAYKAKSMGGCPWKLFR